MGIGGKLGERSRFRLVFKQRECVARARVVFENAEIETEVLSRKDLCPVVGIVGVIKGDRDLASRKIHREQGFSRGERIELRAVFRAGHRSDRVFFRKLRRPVRRHGDDVVVPRLFGGEREVIPKAALFGIRLFQDRGVRTVGNRKLIRDKGSRRFCGRVAVAPIGILRDGTSLRAHCGEDERANVGPFQILNHQISVVRIFRGNFDAERTRLIVVCPGAGVSA